MSNCQIPFIYQIKNQMPIGITSVGMENQYYYNAKREWLFPVSTIRYGGVLNIPRAIVGNKDYFPTFQ